MMMRSKRTSVFVTMLFAAILALSAVSLTWNGAMAYAADDAAAIEASDALAPEDVAATDAGDVSGDTATPESETTPEATAPEANNAEEDAESNQPEANDDSKDASEPDNSGAVMPMDAGENNTPAKEETPAPTPVAGSSKVTIGGVEYTFITSEDGTAVIRRVGGTSEDSRLQLPEVVEIDGFTYQVNGLSLFTENRVLIGNVSQVVIPDTYETISGSLVQLGDVEELVIPGSVKVFEGNFQHMKSLQSVVFGEGVEELAPNTPFASTGNVTSITLPSTLKLISKPAAFAYTAIKSIELPEGIQITEGSAFYKCESLESITLPASIDKIGSNMFAYATALKSVVANGTITSIGANAFNGATSLSEIFDLSQVTEMKYNAFEETTSLEGPLNLSSLKEIPYGAFYLSGVTEVILGEGLESIDDVAFWGSHITDINLPESLTTIGDRAFEYTYYLGWKRDNVLALGDNVTSLGKNAFHGSWIQNVTIGNALSEIPANAFSDNEYLQTVTINNAEDNVLVGSNAFPEDTQVIWLQASVGDVGDKISDSETAMTLQEAVDAAEDGDIIYIDKNIKLDQTLIIREGKNVTIASADGADRPYVIVANKDASLGNLIQVMEGAILKLQNVTLYGKDLNQNVIYNEGELVIDDGTLITSFNSSNSSYASVIRAVGENAKVTMQGGEISGNIINSTYGGSIRGEQGATVDMTGGRIVRNKVSHEGVLTGSGIVIDRAKGTMSGGTIANNTAHRGSAIVLYSWRENEPAEYHITGDALIDHNIAQTKTSYRAGGAVYVIGYVTMTMDGGTISNNTGGSGAGVTITDPGLDGGNGVDWGTTFIMNGGRIINNTGNTGGGIYAFSNNVFLNEGLIAGNTAEGNGGGIYVEGNSVAYSTAHLKNVLIYDNEAYQGGGMWFCPTGSVKIYVTNGGAIYNNTASGAGDSIVIGGSNGNDQYLATIADRILGGGKVDWYSDGRVYVLSGWPLPSVDRNAPRFDAENPGEIVVVEDSNQSYALIGVIGEEAIAHAESLGKLIITGNTARYGGGVGSNGGVEIGEDDELIEVPVEKTWNHGSNSESNRPVSIRVQLLADGKVIDEATLSAENDWKAVFEKLPVQRYTVKEVAVTDYTGTITGDQLNGFVINNTYNPPDNPPHNPPKDRDTSISVSVSKQWEDNNASDRPASVTVQLYKDGEAYGDTVVLSNQNDWSYRWENLDKNATWTVDEISGTQGYSKTVSNKGNSWTIVNTKDDIPPPPDYPLEPPDEPPSNPPETPDTPPETPDTPPEIPEIPPETPNDNPPPTGGTPQTGDTTSATLWLMLFFGALSGALALRRRA